MLLICTNCELRRKTNVRVVKQTMKHIVDSRSLTELPDDGVPHTVHTRPEKSEKY